MHDLPLKLYWRFPVGVQEALLDLYARRLERLYYSSPYRDWLSLYRRALTWSDEETRRRQGEELAALVCHAVKNVPYYADAYAETKWNQVDSAESLQELPLLNKETLRCNEQAFIDQNLDRRRLVGDRTSGTTGKSLRLFWKKSLEPRYWALVEAQVREVAGVHRGMPRAMIGGRPIVAGNTNRPPYWRYVRKWSQLYLSSYHISKATAEAYLSAIRDFGCSWLTGYGSSIAALASAALELGIPKLRLKAVIVSGDTLLEGMRESIETFFCCRCYDHYGQSERVAMAMECSRGQLHVVSPLGVVEIVRPDGTPCEVGEVGEIVATGLFNRAMPLIRYRIGDYAAWAEDQHCCCGRGGQIIDALGGRVDDYLVMPDGRQIGRLSTAMKRSPRVHSAQIVQDEPDHAFLLVCPGKGFQHSDALAILDDLEGRIGHFKFDVLQVREIPRMPHGKQALVVRLFNQSGLKASYNEIPEIAKRTVARL